MSLPIIRLLGAQNIFVSGVFSKGPESHFYFSIISKSRYLNETIIFREIDYELDQIQALINFGKQQKDNPVIFLASDKDMIFTSKYREILKDYFLFTLPPHDVLDTILNKDKFIPFAQKENLPIPKSKEIFGKELMSNSRYFEFPFILKPSWRDINWLNYFGRQKVLYINCEKDIEDNLDKIDSLDIKFLIQEIIPGRESNIFCSFAILNNNSDPIEIGHCKKIRQYPRGFGNTALAEPIFDDELEALSIKIFKILNLKGYASIEYKKDPRDEKFKIMEVTPNRFNRQFAVTNIIGLNLPYSLYNFEVGNDYELPKTIYRKTRWVSEVNEIRAFRSYIISKEYTPISWLKELKRIGLFEIFDKKDLKPFLQLITKTISKIFILSLYRLKSKKGYPNY